MAYWGMEEFWIFALIVLRFRHMVDLFELEAMLLYLVLDEQLSLTPRQDYVNNIISI